MLIGGENFCSPPHLSRGLFAVAANSGVFDGEALCRWVDQPWAHADLYYIEKITAALTDPGIAP